MNELSPNWTISLNHFEDFSGQIPEIHLVEDMFQAFYINYIVDAGWYEGDVPGYLVYLIKDYDWEHPVVRMEASTVAEVKWCLLRCCDYTNLLLQR